MTSDHAAAANDHAADIDKHVRIYITVFVALMVLTIVTVLISRVHLPIPIAISVAMLVAIIKGSLVACYFMHLISEKIAWTADPNTAMVAVLMVDIWKTTPFMALLILAGLQMVPNDIYEAARIDGVNPIKVFWKVTLPLIRPALMVAVIFRALDAFRIFDLIYVLTPNNTQTKSMSVYAKENLFDFDKFALGSAASTAPHRATPQGFPGVDAG